MTKKEIKGLSTEELEAQAKEIEDILNYTYSKMQYILLDWILEELENRNK